MMLTPIPTFYRGTWFRSRQEARWAMMFDRLGLDRWEYEREGYQLATCWYLPDFWLPELSAFAEVKGTTEQWDIHCEIKASDLVKAAKKPLIMLDEISLLGLLPRALVFDCTLPWGYETYWVSLPRSAECGRLWLEKELTHDQSFGHIDLSSQVDAVRRHRFYAPR